MTDDNESRDQTAGTTDAERPTQPAAGLKRVHWDDSKMSSSFANVVNVLNTREEFTLLFGANETWNVLEAEELRVALSNRIVLTPHAAKRLAGLLQQRIADYEARFGRLNV